MRSLSFLFLGLGDALALSAVTAAHEKIIESLIESDGQSVHNSKVKFMIDAHAATMSKADAWKAVDKQPHLELFEKNQDKTNFEVTEEQVDKARNTLNVQYVKALTKLDNVLAGCSNSWSMNKHATDNAISDIKYVEGVKAQALIAKKEAADDKSEYQQKLAPEKEELAKRNKAWEATKQAFTDAIAAMENDVAVSFFILKITGQLVKDHPLEDANPGIPAGPPAGANLLQHQSGIQVCRSEDGKMEYKFMDPRVQLKLESMQEHSRFLMEQVFQDTLAAEAFDEFSFLQLSAQPASSTPPPTQQNATAAMMVSTPPPSSTPTPIPVAEEDPFAKARTCAKGAPARFGLLHDKMSTLLGKFVDNLNAKKKEKAKAELKHAKFVNNKNDQIAMFSGLIQDADNLMASEKMKIDRLDTAADEGKSEKHALQKEKKKMMDECKKQIDQIMKEEVCGLKTVRDEIQKKSTVAGPEMIQDCIVADGFIKGSCMKNGVEISCDNEGKGGMRSLTRAVVDGPNELGAACPETAIQAPCAQFDCPIDCAIAKEHGPWSTCNRLCDGGTQMATYKVKQWPKNGGEKCPNLTEIQECNRNPCNKDCVIGFKDPKSGRGVAKKWSPWSPCSQACKNRRGPGFMERRRAILAKEIGKGKCWTTHDKHRRETKPCNEDIKCVGDEICQANMDLIFLIDSSGSVGQTNFKLLLNLVKELVEERLEAKHLGQPGVNIAAIKFGNGFIQENDSGTPGGMDQFKISDAKILSNWTYDYETFAKNIPMARHARGFTNLAQGLQKAKRLFDLPAGVNGSRHDAMIRKVIVLTEGSISFGSQARDAWHEMDNAGYRVNAVVFNSDQRILNDMKRYVSMPSQSTLLPVSDFVAISTENGRGIVKNDIITSFCSKSESPYNRKKKEITRMWAKVKENFDCPGWVKSIAKASGCPLTRKGYRCEGATDQDIVKQCIVGAKKYDATMMTVGVAGWWKGACFVLDKTQNKDSCKKEKYPWVPKGKKDGYYTTSGWGGGKFNIYKLLSSDQIEKIGATIVSGPQMNGPAATNP